MKHMKMPLRLLSLLLAVVMAVPTVGLISFAENAIPQAASGTSIDLYLIAGQSNAAGHSKVEDTASAYELAPELENGFSHILYAGKGAYSASDVYSWEPTKLGMGRTTSHLGPEAGMAVALSEYYNAETGRIAGIFKYAHGGSTLTYNNKDASTGSWMSPSYAEATDASVGRHYNEFLRLFREKTEALVAMGYTDINIKGLYWMQGEGDRLQYKTYAEALSYLMGDLRADLSDIMVEINVADGGNASEMPLYVGSISETYLLNDSGKLSVNQRFIALQKAFAQEEKNCYFIDNGRYKISAYDAATNTTIALGSDSGHWSQRDALTIGQNVGEAMYWSYGNIPDAHKNNAFAIFKDGAFASSATSWKDANASVKTLLDADEGATVAILLRDDSTVSSAPTTYLPYMNGRMLVDLGGHTLTLNAMFQRGTISSDYTGNYKTSAVVKNGTLLMNGNYLFYTGNDQDNGEDKVIDLTFENVTIGKTENCTKDQTFYVKNGTSPEKNNHYNVTFNDCTFDYSKNVQAKSKVLSFKGTKISADIRINGGKIIMPDADTNNLTFANLNSDQPITFGRGYDGNYPTVTIPAGKYALPTISGVTASGCEASFGGVGNMDDDHITYALVAPRETAYGVIDEDYESATEYPAVAFVNGKFVGAATKWSEIKTVAKNVLGNGVTTVTVLLRDDVATDSPIYLYDINGTLEIDLGGHTVTAKSTVLFNGKVYSTYTGDYESSVIVKNGTVVVDGKYVYYSENVQTQGAPKVMNLTFENVTFGKTSTSTQNQTFFAGYDNAAATENNTLNLTLNGCTVDFSEGTLATNLFHFSRLKKGSANVVVNGGSIVGGKDGKNLNLYTGCTLKLGKCDGAYPMLLLADGASVPGAQYTTTENGKQSFGKTGAETFGGVAYGVYELGTMIEGYGFVPAQYSDATEYPLVVFMSGRLVGATSDWASSHSLAKTALEENNGATVTVLLRDDVTVTAAPAGSASLSYMNGTVVFDLAGHTVTANALLFKGTVGAEYKGDFVSNAIVKNGTLFMNTNYVFLTQNGQIDGTDKVLNLTLESVTIGKSSSCGMNQTFYAGANNSPTKNNHFNFVLNDCIFDYSESTKAGNLFSFNRETVSANVTVNGGSILGPTSDYKLTLIRLNSGSTFAFGKGSDGYTTLTLPEGANTPTDSLSSNAFKNVDGDGVAFVKIGDAYRLALTELKLTGAYLNLASDINVIYSANVPAGYENPYMVFEFGGKSYTVREYTVAEDGELLFAFEGVTPQLIGENIKATLFATKGGEETSVEKAEYSVLVYCKNMLAKTDDEALKTLLSDLLVYGAASQTYLGYKTDALVTDGLDLTPSTFAPLASTDKALLGTADARVSWKGVALRYENAMAMKFNFKADASLTLKVTINGRDTTYALSELAADGNGNYTVYFRGILATEYGDTVTAALYDGDVQVGQSVTYSVNSYVYSMQESADAALAALVQATYNYGASAESYAGK